MPSRRRLDVAQAIHVAAHPGDRIVEQVGLAVHSRGQHVPAGGGSLAIAGPARTSQLSFRLHRSPP
jgi:hypothetical protein